MSDEKKSKEEEQTLAFSSSPYFRRPKYQLVQNFWIKQITLACLPYNKPLLTKLSWSVRENLHLIMDN